MDPPVTCAVFSLWVVHSLSHSAFKTILGFLLIPFFSLTQTDLPLTKFYRKRVDNVSLAQNVYFLFSGILNLGHFLSFSYTEGRVLIFGFCFLCCLLEHILSVSDLLSSFF